MKLNEYLNNERIKCFTDLSRDNWKRLLESNKKITETMDKWKEYNINIEIGSIHTYQKSSEKEGSNDCFYNADTRSYIYYTIAIDRNLTPRERKNFGSLAKNMQFTVQLPISLWFTVLRAEIQKKKKYAKNRYCRCCGAPIKY